MSPVDNYILKQYEDKKNILLFLRQIILETIPEIQEKFKYSIPFYYLNGKPFCYFNIPKSKKETYVDLCFIKGFELSNQQNILFAGNNRTMVKSIPYFYLHEINIDLLKEVLLEAKTLQ